MMEKAECWWMNGEKIEMTLQFEPETLQTETVCGIEKMKCGLGKGG